MPVIRGAARAPAVTAEQRKRIAEQLALELSGQQTPGGPVVFEIPFDEQDRIDVLVVWDAWEPFGSADRSGLILDAYGATAPKAVIAQALGVTYREAIEQQVLPYAVVPLTRRGETDDEMKKAMLAEGGFVLPDGKVDLRFPTMALAAQAHERLAVALPKACWSLVQAVGYLR